MIKNIKVLFLTILLFSFINPLFSQEKLGKLNTSWSAVIPGSVIAEPAITSYGFCLVTDGKLISAFSNKGELLWEKSTRSSRNVSISTLSDDFLLLWDKRHKEIKLLNPSGGEVWNKKLSFDLTQKPFIGRDGRFFITGKNILECYGMNGVRKWVIDTPPQKELPLQELPNGDVVLFLREEGNKTLALRVSPYGKIQEEITFAGTVTDAFTTSDGVFLIFNDGSAGMFSVKDKISQNKWVIHSQAGKSTLVVYNNLYLYLELYNNKVVVNKLNSNSGEIIHSFCIENINGYELTISKLTTNGLFIADNKNAYLFGNNGNKKWSAVMPENEGNSKWNYLFYTNDNHLVFCLKNWSVNAYLTSQNLSNSKIVRKASYDGYYKIDTMPYMFSIGEVVNNKIASDERYEILKNGNYGEKEIIFTSDLYSLATAYLNKSSQKLGVGRGELTLFETNEPGVQKAFYQLPLLGTDSSANYIGKLLLKSSNSSYTQCLLKCVASSGYDPDCKILNALKIVIPKINRNDTNLLKIACDAVYSVCLFMGRPAFNKMGKEIIKDFMGPKYGEDIRKYAIETLGKIVELDS